MSYEFKETIARNKSLPRPKLGIGGFKIVIKQTAASVWNYDFIHRDVYRLAVEDSSYKRALEGFARQMGWNFEVEYHNKISYEYKRLDKLFIETP
ncbi:MAG: hypothetical protein DRO00_04420 [Thermoproteota archaeon]|nr:MAG: hypothetical protein DRO00_04420 [Candidatus Korarchaeota archaeon]